MAVLATDNFNRADVNPIGSPWTAPNAGPNHNFRIVSNTAQEQLLAQDAAVFNTSVTWPNNHYSQAKVTVTGVDGGTGPGCGVRMATSDNYYRLILDHASSGNAELAKFVSGSYTQLWSRTQAFTDGATFYLEVQGTTLIAKHNGTAIGASATDSSLSTGSPGLTYSSPASSASLDDWEGGDFSSGFPGGDEGGLWYMSIERG